MSGTTGRSATVSAAVVGVLLSTGALAVVYAVSGAGVGVFGLLGLCGLVGCVRNPRGRVVADPFAQYPVMGGSGPVRHRRRNRAPSGIHFSGQAPGKDAFTGALHANQQTGTPQPGIPQPRTSDPGRRAAPEAAPTAPGWGAVPVRSAPAHAAPPAPVGRGAPPAPTAPEPAGRPAQTAIMPAVAPADSVEAKAGRGVPTPGRHSRDAAVPSSGTAQAGITPTPGQRAAPGVPSPVPRQRDREQPAVPGAEPPVPRRASAGEWFTASDRHVVSGSLHDPVDTPGTTGGTGDTGATAEAYAGASGSGQGHAGHYPSSVTRDGGIRLPPAPPLHAGPDVAVPDPRWPEQDSR